MSGLERVRRRAEHAPARDLVGLETVGAELGKVVTSMPVTPWMLDDRGRLAVGAIGFLGDSSMANAGNTVLEAGQFSVTATMHLELSGAIPDDLRMLVSHSSVVFHDDLTAVTAARITDDTDRLLATGVVRTIIVRNDAGQLRMAGDRPGTAAAGDPGPGRGGHPGLGPSPVDALEPGELPFLVRSDLREALAAPVARALGFDAVVLADGRAHLRTTAAAHLANSLGGIHGGMGAFMGEQAALLALRSASEAGSHPVVRALQVSYLRPVPAAGQPMEWLADVPQRGRRLLTARAELADPAGKPAVLVTLTATPS